MDVLIDLIIYLIKQAAAGEKRSAGPKGGRPGQPPRMTPAQQLQTMQRTLAAQAARTRPAPTPRGAAATRGPRSWAQPAVRAAVPPVNQPAVPMITPDAAAPRRPVTPARAIPGLKLPFLLGEVLSQPVSMRED